MKKHPRHWKSLKVETPAIYKIRVQGPLDTSWADEMGGMQITTERMEDETDVTTLVGRIADQAALTGIINALYGMQLPVLTVECLEADDS